MTADLHCPVEILNITAPESSGGAYSLLLGNLSSEAVNGVSLLLTAESGAVHSERISVKLAAGQRAQAQYKPDIPLEDAEPAVERVWFESGTVWRRTEGSTVAYVSNALPAGRALDRLRYAGGSDLVGYPSLQAEAWICACGRANALDDETCIRCGRGQAKVFRTLNEEAVARFDEQQQRRLDDKARKAREGNNVLQENREKAMARQRRRRGALIRWLCAALILCGLAAVFAVWGLPALKYGAACDLLSAGSWNEAREAFVSLKDYRDSAEKMQACDYGKSEENRLAGGEPALRAAAEGFAALGDYEDSAEKERMSRYALGETLLAQERYEEAEEIFLTLGEYSDSADRAKGAVYAQALSLQKAGDPEAARTLFASVQDWQDSKARIGECTGAIGLEAMKNGDWLTAIAELENAPESFAVQLKQAHYGLAEEYAAAGEYEDAGVEYIAAGDHSDAALKASDSLYRLALDHMEEKNWEKAEELFSLIPEYLDAEGQILRCRYLHAAGLKENGDYAAAAELFRTAGTYDDAAEQALDCLYRKALAALAEGNAQEAEAFLSEAEGSAAAEKKLKSVRWELAEADHREGRYAEALERYEQLNGYKSSRTRAKDCRYRLALQALEAGETAQAEEALSALGAYKDSAALLKDCRYRLAAQALAGGDTERAAELYELLGSYEDSGELLAACRITLADRALNAGDTDTAAAMLLLLNGREGTEELQERLDALTASKEEETPVPGEGPEADRTVSEDISEKAENVPEGPAGITEAAALPESREEPDVNEPEDGQETAGQPQETEEPEIILSDPRLGEAALLETEQRFGDAASLYEAIGTEDALALVPGLKYKAAEQLLAAGEFMNAAEAFAELDGYEDSLLRTAECLALYKSACLEQVRALLDSGDYEQAAVIAEREGGEAFDALRGEALYRMASSLLEQEEYGQVIALAEKENSEDLNGLAAKAHLQLAESLYRSGDIYPALPHYRAAADREEAAAAALNRECYLLLGSWESAAGNRAEFREDGTCSLFGEELCFRRDGNRLYTGASADGMTVTHRLSQIDPDRLTLRDVRGETEMTRELFRTEASDAE